MILLYCDDVAKRRSVHNYFRDKGVMIEAVPLNEFAVRSYAYDASAMLVIGDVPPGFSAFLCAEVPLISVSKYPVGNSLHFRDYDSPELLDLLLSFSDFAECFEYNGVLKATPRGVTFLGYNFSLTPAERSILALLVSRTGENVTFDEIGEVCLGDIHTRFATVSKHISSINKKAQSIGGRNMIVSPESKCYAINKYI